MDGRQEADQGDWKGQSQGKAGRDGAFADVGMIYRNEDTQGTPMMG